MVESGGFNEDTRVELIRGEIVDMPPIGFEHGWSVNILTMLMGRFSEGKALVWAQSAIRVGERSRPQPDIALLQWRDDYSRERPPSAQDVLLVVEVAETSARYDRHVKGPLYAEAGIPEYWIVNLQEGVIEVYTNPIEGAYKQVRSVRRGETLALPGSLEGAIEVGDVLGKGREE